MWGVAAQLPVRALSLGTRVWALHLRLLSLGLWAPLLCVLVLLRALCVCVRGAARVGLAAACSAALTAHVCGVYIFLQGGAWCAQLAGSWVTLHLRFCRALLETFTCVPWLPLWEQAAGLLVRAGVQTGRVLAQVQGVAVLAQLCAHTAFLGLCWCAHLCFAAISSTVRVRVHAPLSVSLPFTVHAPLSLGVRVRLRGQRHDRAQGEVGIPQGEIREEQTPQVSRRPRPTRRREESQNRNELSSGGYVRCPPALGASSFFWLPGQAWACFSRCRKTLPPVAPFSRHGCPSPSPTGR